MNVDRNGKPPPVCKVNKSWPPSGNFVIPRRTDYSTFSPASPAPFIADRIKRAVDYARMCLDNERTDLAEIVLKDIWANADAIQQRLALDKINKKA